MSRDLTSHKPEPITPASEFFDQLLRLAQANLEARKGPQFASSPLRMIRSIYRQPKYVSFKGQDYRHGLFTTLKGVSVTVSNPENNLIVVYIENWTGMTQVNVLEFDLIFGQIERQAQQVFTIVRAHLLQPALNKNNSHPFTRPWE